MKAASPFYGLANFAKGTRVQIADRTTLEEFLRAWKLHHELQAEQLEFASRVAEVVEVSMYHGGDILYRLKGVPGIWHQRLLGPAT